MCQWRKYRARIGHDLLQLQPLCIGGQQKGPLSAVFSLYMESRRAEYVAELLQK